MSHCCRCVSPVAFKARGEDTASCQHLIGDQDREDAMHVVSAASLYSDKCPRIAYAPVFHFPVRCVKVSAVLRMTEFRSYGCLHDVGELHEPTEQDVVHLISHEWLAFDHPDPDAVQLRRLQEILTVMAGNQAEHHFSESDWEALTKHVSRGSGPAARLSESGARAECDADRIRNGVIHGLIWMDFCSVPQNVDVRDNAEVVNQQQKAAIMSIPAYVERADFFWVLTPTATHRDTGKLCNFNSWRERGWCRMEEWTNFLSSKPKTPLLITSRDKICTLGRVDHIVSHAGKRDKSVFSGEFSCCRLGHVLNGEVIPCDKELLAPILSEIYKSGLQEMHAGNSFMHTVLLMVFDAILHGCSLAEPEPKADEGLVDFLRRVGMSSLDEFTPGMHALHAAMLCAHPAVVIEIARMRPQLVAQANAVGWTPLMAGARRHDEPFDQIFAAGVGFEKLEAIQAVTPKGLTALHHACVSGFSQNAEALLRNKADVDARRRDNAYTPLLSAAANGYPDCVRLLLTYRADISACDVNGENALHLACDPLSFEGNASNAAKRDVIATLIDAGVSLDHQRADGLSALQVAEEAGFSDAARMIADASGVRLYHA